MERLSVESNPNLAPRVRADLDSLGASLARVAGTQCRVELRGEPPAWTSTDWLRCTDLLADPGELRRWLRRTARWLGDEYGAAPQRTAASYVMSWYLRVPAYVGALLFHHERRVPMLRPEELAVRRAAEGRPHATGIAVLGRSFYCLPLDPGAGRPEATVVADEQALGALLRARFTAHAARFINSYRHVGPLGARTLWAGATDALETSLWWAGLDGGDEGMGVADAALVLQSQHPPLTSASTLRLRPGADGDRTWSRQRASCCFTYLLPGKTECDGCPRRRGAGEI